MTILTEPILAQVKSRLSPLFSLMMIKERLIECLPWKFIRIDLKATDDLAVINVSKGEYHATVNAAVFDMMIAPASPKGGWYNLEAALVRNHG